MPLTVRLGSQKRIFLPKGEKETRPPLSPKHNPGDRTARREFGSRPGRDAGPRDLASARSPAAGSGRSTRPARLHGSASRAALPAPARRQPGAPGPTAACGGGGAPVARAQRARRAQGASPRAGDAQGLLRPRLPLLLLAPRAGCGRGRRRGQAARRPSHAAILTRAASPVRGLPQSKGNFLVSRQRNNAPAREGAPGSPRLRLPRAPEAARAAAPAPRAARSGPGSRLGPRSSASSSPCPPDFHFSPLGGPGPRRRSRGQRSALSLSSPTLAPASLHTQSPLPVFLPIFLVCFLQGLFFPGLN